MSILLILLLSSSAVVATIHQDRRQAFRSAAERLPGELEDRIWGFYPEMIYGDNPNSPILSLDETQALFPPLHLDLDHEWEEEETVWYRSERLNQTMTTDRYLTLFVTESTDRNDQNDLNLLFKTDSYCPIEMRYFVAHETVQQWPRAWLEVNDGYDLDFSISKAELNDEQEPGTQILLYIPPECTLTLVRVFREIGRQHFDSQAEEIPENISLST